MEGDGEEVVDNDNFDEAASDDEESRKVKKMMDPLLPSESEVREHQLTHLPFRNWCHHCVRGRGKETNHTKKDRDVRGLDEFHVDYCFPGDEFGHRLSVLVAVEKYSGMKASVVVPSKGSTGAFAARKVVELMNECGNKDADIILKSDQEPAIKFLVDDICKNRTGAKTIEELAPIRSKGSNGVVERAVSSVESYIRSLKSQLDERYKVKISVDHPIVVCLCDYAAYLLNRLEIGRDGKTSYERSKGKKATVLGFEFGEKVMWKTRTSGHMQKMNAQWNYGVFVGVKRVSGELYIANEQDKKIKLARTARRVPEEQRWQGEQLDWVQFVPWNLGREDKDADGDLPEFDFKSGPGARMTEEDMEHIAMMGKPDRGPHPAHLSKKDFETYGYTDRCQGCSTLLRGMRLQPHSATCRKRMEERLEGDVRVQNAKDRMADRQRQVQQQEPKDSDGVALVPLPKKRCQLDDIEDKVLVETDPIKLEALFKQYSKEYNASLKRARVENEDADMENSGGASASRKRSSDMPLNELEANINQIISHLDDMEDRVNMDVRQIFEEYDQTYAWDDANIWSCP